MKGRLTEVFLRVASEVPLAVGVLGMPEGVIPVVEQWWPEVVYPRVASEVPLAIGVLGMPEAKELLSCCFA